MKSDVLLPMTLAIAVPLRIRELQERGGPSEADWGTVREFEWLMELPEHGEALLFKVDTPGLSAKMFNLLSRVVAVMSFVPGGITLMGLHFETE